MKHLTFKTQSAEFAHRSGQPVRILRELGDAERDPEVGRMFRIAFEDGITLDAFEDELSKEVEAA